MRLPQELELFIASPGDVQAERNIVKEVADRAVRICGVSLGARIRVTGWEDVPPELGRPQALINPLVDTCDIFVGVLNRRLGSDTGVTDSGFIEEFERAAARRTGGSSTPAIALFFRRLPPDELEDAGPQLSRLLDFRQRISDEHMALYRDFGSTDDLERQLTDYVVGYLAQRAASTSSTNEVSGPNAPLTQKLPEDTEEPPEQGELTEARRQLTEMLTSYEEAVRGAELKPGLDGDRLVLFSLAVRGEGLLPTHVANRLYRRREELELVDGEITQWLRAIVRDMASHDDAHMVVPGWRITGGDDVVDRLESLIGDEEDAVVRGTLRLLERLQARPSYLWPGQGASSDDVRGASEIWHSVITQLGFDTSAIVYMASKAGPDDAGLIEAIEQLKPEHPWAGEVEAILSGIRGDYEGMISLAEQNSGALLSWIGVFLIGHLGALTDQALGRLILKTKGDFAQGLQLMAFQTLVDRNAVSVELLVGAIAGALSSLREVALAYVEASENATQLATELLPPLHEAKGGAAALPRLLAMTADPEELNKAARSPLGADEWEASLWRSSREHADEARELLRDGAASWIEKQMAEGPFTAQEDLLSYLYGRRARAAVGVLGRLQNDDRRPDDAALIRTELQRGAWVSRGDAALALATFQDAADAPAILAGGRPGTPTSQAAIVAAAINVGGPTFTRTLLQEPDTPIAIAAARAIAEIADPAELIDILKHKAAQVRMIALDRLTNELDRAALESLLHEYESRETYFYNVVAGLDRWLYGPSGSARLRPDQT